MPKYVGIQFFYKELALRWQIAKQLSGLNFLLLLNNKTYRLNKSAVVINAKYLLNQQYTKIQLSQKHYWENFKITYHKYRF